MKILLVGINARYTHRALAIEYLSHSMKDIDIEGLEFNINQQVEDIYGEILSHNPDVVAFSTYIWNIDYVEKLSSDLAQVLDGTIVWGGLEASFDREEHFKNNPGLDIIVRGEGEISCYELFKTLKTKGDLSDVLGISYRKGDTFVDNDDRPLIADLDSIPSPFIDYKAPKGKMIYYEMSRGCPFKCTYCMSSTIKGVRYFSKERIKSDLTYLMDSGAKIIKLVDRTFNANEEHSIEIMTFIRDTVGDRKITFHTELMAHLISDEFLDFLETLPKDLFQFEIGIQSSNQKTLKEIKRVTDLERLDTVVKRIRSMGNIHQHVDLIAGLPYEDYDSFKDSFNFAYSLGAEKLQLGFLKLLRGSEMKYKAKDYGMRYNLYPPYEILSTKWIDARELRKLKIIEDLVEKFSNEDHFRNTLNYLMEGTDPFSFYEELSNWWEENKYHKIAHSRNNLYKLFFNYLKNREDIGIIQELMRFDFLLNNNQAPPEYLRPKSLVQKDYHNLVRDEKIRELYDLDDRPTKFLVRDFRFEKLDIDGERVYGFYYGKEFKSMDITEEYERICFD